MRILSTIAVALLATLQLVAQGTRKDDIVARGYGGATITICTNDSSPITLCGGPTTPLVQLYDDMALTTPKAEGNPFLSSAEGNFHFYVAPGLYKLQISAAFLSHPVVFPDYGVGVSGSAKLSFLNGRYFTDTFPYTTLDQRINACNMLVISYGGGICDATGEWGVQRLAAPISVGNHSQVPVALLLPHYGTWTVDINDPNACGVTQYGGTSIISTANGGSGRMEFRPNFGVTVADALYCTEANPLNGGQYVRMDGVTFYSHSTTYTTATFRVRDTFDNSTYTNVTVADYVNDNVLVEGACCGTSFINLTANAQFTGKRAVWVKAGNGKTNHGVSFITLSAGHSGTGYANIEISGSAAATPTDAVNVDIHFFNVYSEDSGIGTTSDGMLIVDARNISIDGMTAGINGGAFKGIHLKQTAAHSLRSIRIHNFRLYSPTCCGIVNDITGESLMTSTAYIPTYIYGGESNGGTGTQNAIPSVYVDSKIQFKDDTGNLIWTAPPTSTWSPAGDNVADLGDSTHRFRYVFVGTSVGTNTSHAPTLFTDNIYMGSDNLTRISTTLNGGLGFNYNLPGATADICLHFGGTQTCAIAATASGTLKTHLPTSCSGQPTGTLWNNANVVNVCP